MIDPILLAVVFRFDYRRLWSRGGHTFASARPADGAPAIGAVGRNATDALAELLARWRAQRGGVDA